MAAAVPPEKKSDRLFDFRRLNVIFALASLGLLAVTLLMVVVDYGRPWKRFQSEFLDLERRSVLRELRAERQLLSQEQVTAVQADIAAARDDLAARRGEIRELEEEMEVLDKRIFEADASMRAKKSELDAAQYDYDSSIQVGDENRIARAKEKMDSLAREWREDRKVLEEYQTQRRQRQQELSDLRAGLTASQSKLKEMSSALDALQLRLSTLSKDIDYFLLNAPLMDFLQPSLKIEQVILPGLFHDINFTTIDRVDRCMTCHVAANREGFEGEEWPEPFRTHPRLDLFLGSNSPHPYGGFGCTVCHAGLDRATDFARAGHSPVDAEQRRAWTEEYDWEPQKYLDTPIHPAPYSESGCLACHDADVWIPESRLVDTGRELILKMGCNGCHRIDYPAFLDLPRPGPTLRKVAEKTDAAWAAKWVAEPRSFRQTTFMPHFFYVENIRGEENLARQRAEIEGIVDYLWDESEVHGYPAASEGDAERGEDLFFSLGCAGCHIRDPEASRGDLIEGLERLHGPNLSGLGSKVTPEWLSTWLRDPKQYRSDTPMPDLRLSDAEVADLLSYLLESRNQDFENLTRESVDEGARAELVLSYLQNVMTIEESEARLLEMDAHEQSVYLGRQTIGKYGCFSCHDIEGYGETKPIGVELTKEGSKPLHLFDFGHRHEVPHTRHDWIREKMLRPRGWDQGRELVKTYDELARMPEFGMSVDEAGAVTASVLGFTKPSALAEKKSGDSERTAALGAGRKLVSRYNCKGCHLVEGSGQAIEPALRDENNLPPNLAAEGARTQAPWLFRFLKDPAIVTLRPWLSVRMPTFGFSDEQMNRLVSYFGVLDGQETFESDPGPPSRLNLAVGEEIFNMLQCARCHPAGPEALEEMGGIGGDLAPSLLLGPERLRHGWLASWIKEPQTWVPGTKMPTNFPEVQPGEFQSPLPNGVEMPEYVGNKRRMMRHFDSEEELHAFLADVDRVSEALRDYTWSL